MRLYHHENQYYLFRDHNGTPQYATIVNNEVVWHNTFEGVQFSEVRSAFVDGRTTIPRTAMGRNTPPT